MKNAYLSLALQSIVSGVIMYLVMFVMIDRLDSFYNNLNMLYMTLMMVAPMVVLMVLTMRHMFPSSAANAFLLAAAVAVFFGSFFLIRTQTTIGDEAFLRSMIPHHSGAVLMCRKASLSDPELTRLCSAIVRSQLREIDEMKSILQRIEPRSRGDPALGDPGDAERISRIAAVRYLRYKQGRGDVQARSTSRLTGQCS